MILIGQAILATARNKPGMEAKLLAPPTSAAAFPARRRISVALQNPRRRSCLTVLPSNLCAIETAFRFSQGLQPLVAIAGPSGWGKSEVLAATCEELADTWGAGIRVRSAVEWLGNSERAESHEPLVLDDVQDAFRGLRSRHMIRQRLERRVRLRRPTMVSGVDSTSSVNHWISQLPSPREWGVAWMSTPTVDERDLIVRQLAHDEGLVLGLATVRLVASQLHGNGRSISGALQRLHMVKSDWTAVDDVFLAGGVLMPYLIGRDGWDLRDEISDVVGKCLQNEPGGRNLHAEICALLMLDTAKMVEGDVATFLGLRPLQAYRLSQKARRNMSDPGFEAIVASCKKALQSAFEKY